MFPVRLEASRAYNFKAEGQPKRTLIAQNQLALRCCNDAQTDMPKGIPMGAMCVQRLDDSLNSAIHINYRVSLRSSSMREPRDPLLKVLIFIRKWFVQTIFLQTKFKLVPSAGLQL
jgi:hypothetical protein